MSGHYSLVNAIVTALTNEKLAPEILPYEEELVADIIVQTKEQEKMIEQLQNEPYIKNIQRMDLDRVLYCLRSYLRTRLFKIELYSQHICQGGDDSLLVSNLSAAELKFAQQFQLARDNHFKASFLHTLPEKHQALDKPEMVAKPNLGTYVFTQAMDDLGLFRVDEEESFAVKKDDVYLIPYAPAKKFIPTKGICLI
eukprot:c13897_g1_i1.p1 GENE.c13897_g1_i1~~c13897_g1_i1.p1  ORF type:complete len:197 (+),score=56.50 c13897_g1_i1:2-592(+)